MQTDRELLQMALDYAKALHNGGSRVYVCVCVCVCVCVFVFVFVFVVMYCLCM